MKCSLLERLNEEAIPQFYIELILFQEAAIDIADRKDSSRMNRSLAIISILAIFSAWVDSYAFVELWSAFLSATAISALQRVLFILISGIAGYAILHLLKGNFDMLINKKQRKNKKDSQKT